MPIFSALKMEATGSSETSVVKRPVRLHIAGDAILYGDRGENLKSYTSTEQLCGQPVVSYCDGFVAFFRHAFR
jgi:hypothetical protein